MNAHTPIAMDSLKTRLLYALQERGISQATLAAILEIPRSSVSNWLNHDSIPTNQLVKLSRELNISIDWLVCGVGPEKMFGPQHVSQTEKNLVESLRNLGEGVTQSYLQLLLQMIKPAYGETPYEAIGFSRFMEESHVPWAIVGYDGKIISASGALFDLLAINRNTPDELIGTPVFNWIADEYISAAMVAFARFLEGSNLPSEPPAFHCRVLKKSREPTAVLTMYYSYEIYPENHKKNKIHVTII